VCSFLPLPWQFILISFPIELGRTGVSEMRARQRSTLPFNATADSSGSRLTMRPCRWNTRTTIRKNTYLPRQCEKAVMNPYRLVPDPCKNFILLHHRRNISRGKRVRATSLVSSLLRTVRSSRGREKVRVKRQHCVLLALVVVVVDIFRLFIFLACDIVGHLRLTPFYFSFTYHSDTYHSTIPNSVAHCYLLL